MNHTTFNVRLAANWSAILDGQYLTVESSQGCAYIHHNEVASFCTDESGRACVSTKHAFFRFSFSNGDDDGSEALKLLDEIHVALCAPPRQRPLDEAVAALKKQAAH